MAEAAEQTAGRPDPSKASTPAEFVEAMRRLKLWRGVGYRALEKRAAARGQVLPRSTLTAVLARDALPREDLVVAFTIACGSDENEVARWLAARRRIAAGTVPAHGDRDATPGPAPRATSAGRISLVGVAVLVTAVVAGTIWSASGPTRNDADQRGPSAAAAPRGTGPPVGTRSEPGWTPVRTGNGIALPIGRGIDFDSGQVRARSWRNIDIAPDNRGDRITAKNGAQIVRLAKPGGATLQDCEAEVLRWSAVVDGVYALATGTNFCVQTTEHRLVVFTLDHVPAADHTDPEIRLSYRSWQRATSTTTNR